MKPMSLWRVTLLFLLSLSISFYTFQYARYGKPHGLILTMLDVGQGDAFLLQTPHNQFVLIDTGATDQVIRELSGTLPFLHRSLDYIFLSHEDKDHIGGYLAIHDAYTIDHVFSNGQERTTTVAQQTRASFKDSIHHTLHLGDSVSIDGVDIKVLWPDRKASPDDDPNTFSIVLLITYNNLNMVFTGDAPHAVEVAIQKEIPEKIEILKVGHHGAKTSTLPEFIQHIQPRIALISAGKNNRYGHPTAQTLKTLQSVNTKIYGTKEEGRVRIECNLSCEVI